MFNVWNAKIENDQENEVIFSIFHEDPMMIRDPADREALLLWRKKESLNFHLKVLLDPFIIVFIHFSNE